jgi:hypothetical protein
MRGVLTLCVLLLHCLQACTAFVNRPSAIHHHTQVLRGGARSERITHRQKTQQQLDMESSDSMFSSESDADIKSVAKKTRSPKRKKAARKHSKPQRTYTEFSDSEPDEEEVGVEIKRLPASSFDDDWFDSVDEPTPVRTSSSADVDAADDSDAAVAAAAHTDAPTSSEVHLTSTAVEVTVTVGADSDDTGAASEADSTDASIHAVKGSDTNATVDNDTSSIVADDLQERAVLDSEASVEASSEDVEQSDAAVETITTAAKVDTVRSSASDTDTAVRAAADALDSDDADFDEAIADSAAELFDSLTLSTKTFKGDLLDLDLDLSDLDLSNLDMADLDDIDEASSAELVELADADSSSVSLQHAHNTQTAVDNAVDESSEAVAVTDTGVTEDVAGESSSSAEIVADESEEAILPQELHDTTEDVCNDNDADDVKAVDSENGESESSTSADEQSDAEQLNAVDDLQSHAATAAAADADNTESAEQSDDSSSSEAEQSDTELVDAVGGSSSSSEVEESSVEQPENIAVVESGSSDSSSSEAEKSEAEFVEAVAVESNSSDSSSEAEQSDAEPQAETVVVLDSSSDSSSEAEPSDAAEQSEAAVSADNSFNRSSSSEENSESSEAERVAAADVSEEQLAESAEESSDDSDVAIAATGSIDDSAEADDVIQLEQQQQQQQRQTVEEWLDEELTAPVTPEPARIPLSEVKSFSDWTEFDDDSELITTSSSSSGKAAATTKGKKDSAGADTAVDGAQLLDQKLASAISSQFEQTLKQLLALIVVHGYAQIVRSYSRDKQTVNLYRLSGGLTAACIVLDTLIARAIRSTPHSDDDADAMFDVTATSPLGTLLGKKPRLQSVTADAHDLMVLRTTRVWSIAYLLVGCVLSAVCSDLEPLFIAAYVAFRRYIQEPLYAQYVKPGEKLQFVRPYTQPNRLNNVLGAPYTAEVVVPDDADTAEVDSTSSSSSSTNSSRHKQQQHDTDSDASSEQEEDSDE